jgi:hypothetical protein
MEETLMQETKPLKLTKREANLKRLELEVELKKSKVDLKKAASEVAKPIFISTEKTASKIYKKNTEIEGFAIYLNKIHWLEVLTEREFKIYTTPDLYYRFVYETHEKMVEDLEKLL